MIIRLDDYEKPIYGISKNHLKLFNAMSDDGVQVELVIKISAIETIAVEFIPSCQPFRNADYYKIGLTYYQSDDRLIGLMVGEFNTVMSASEAIDAMLEDIDFEHHPSSRELL